MIKDKDKKTGINEILFGGINILFAFICLCIMFSVLVLDKSVSENPYPNNTVLPAFVFFLGAAVFIVLSCFCLRRLERSISDTGYIIALVLLGIITFIIQLIISLQFPVNMGADFASVREAAIGLASGNDLSKSDYMSKYSNNVNIAVLLAFLYRIFGSYRPLIIIGALLTDLSVIISAVTVRIAAGNRLVSISVCIIGEILASLTYRAFIPYTDNYVMIFISLCILLYFIRIKNTIRLPLMFVVTAAGFLIKPVAAVPLAAIIICYVFDINTVRKLASKKGIITALICVFIVSTGIGTNTLIWKGVGYKQSNRTVGWEYYFMLGQDDTKCGTFKGTKYRQSYQQITAEKKYKSERSAAYIDKGLEWIGERGLSGNIVFYEKKLDCAYNDGEFNNNQLFDEDIKDNALIYDIFCTEGGSFPTVAGVHQFFWFIVLALMLCGGFLCFIDKKNSRGETALKIMLIGITLYLLIFENRAKYLYAFLPVYLCFAGMMLNRI